VIKAENLTRNDVREIYYHMLFLARCESKINESASTRSIFSACAQIECPICQGITCMYLLAINVC